MMILLGDSTTKNKNNKKRKWNQTHQSPSRRARASWSKKTNCRLSQRTKVIASRSLKNNTKKQNISLNIPSGWSKSEREGRGAQLDSAAKIPPRWTFCREKRYPLDAPIALGGFEIEGNYKIVHINDISKRKKVKRGRERKKDLWN